MCNDGQSAIVGDKKGRTMILKLSDNLFRKSQRDEKQFMNVMSKRKTSVGSKAKIARRKAEAFHFNEECLLAEDWDETMAGNFNGMNTDTYKQQNNWGETNNRYVDNLLQSFDLTKIDEEVDKFYVNLVNNNLSKSVNTK